MKTLATLLLSAAFGLTATAQTTITNAGFENWGNASPGVAGEPTSWYSNKSGSLIASIGPQTCFKDSLDQHSGSYCVKMITENYLGTAVNGVVTTGVVNAPSTSKASGYIGTVNYSTSSDDSRMPFTGRPDSLVGWYKYTPGGTGEMGKIRCILHTADYYDPETPTTDHPDPTANKIADDTFFTPTTTVATWTRFSVPFTYVSSATPTYIMINATASANQTTTVSGSTMWLDDLDVIYNTATAVSNTVMNEDDATVYAYEKTLCVNFAGGNAAPSVITVLDITGKQVFSGAVTNNKFSTYNLSNLNTGIYIYQLSNNNYRKTGKIFIQ